jgi:DNA polymerase-3 subunit alpha
MLAQFPGHEEVVWESGKIADRCNFEFQTGKLFFPNFQVPQDRTPEEHFQLLCREGLDALVQAGQIPLDLLQQYKDRLELEADLIIRMGFVGYFLVVSDFIQWAKKQGIPVGPGRGSAAGSLVAWALSITGIDPIKYNLLFERFLNPERVSMPDIDIDFCVERRDEVINYVRERYGHDKVCQIITFGTMMAKGVIKDAARALGFPFEDSNALTDLIPDQLKITLTEALEQESDLKKLVDGNSAIKHLFDIAFRLEGLVRHASKHAAGIVISPEPIAEMLPVYIPPKTTDLVTQFAMTELESLGFLKMDFLGLKNLTLIERAVSMIRESYDAHFSIETIPLDDRPTFLLLSRGDTSGVFQLESEGLKQVLRRLQPDKFEDIIAVNALYRPGPLGSGMVDDYIERRHGRQKVTYQFTELQEILEETYGVIVYQEQVMKIASSIGGYSLGEADLLRRAMGKKKADEMAQHQAIFVGRAKERGFDETKARELFDLMAYFAGYGFNKSHSAAYALIAYQTAYLKAHYPAEFMACLITLESDDAEKMAIYLSEARQMGLAILPPSVNKSLGHFSVEEGAIRFGLRGIKNVGDAALASLFSQRSKGGTFKDLFDFCFRIDLRTSNKRVLENLIYAGAFDELPGSRGQKLADLEQVIDKAADQQRLIETGQLGLFGLSAPTAGSGHATYPMHTFSTQGDLPDALKLDKEKEVLGLYVTARPLDHYKHVINAFSPHSSSLLRSKDDTPPVRLIMCGVLKSKRIITTKKGDKMAFIALEDDAGTFEVTAFSRTYQAAADHLDNHSTFIIVAKPETVSATVKLIAHEIIPLPLIAQEGLGITKLVITLPLGIQADSINQLHTSCGTGTIPLELIVHEGGKKVRIVTKLKVAFSQKLCQELHAMGGSISATV